MGRIGCFNEFLKKNNNYNSITQPFSIRNIVSNPEEKG
jgi:hypothetical protein